MKNTRVYDDKMKISRGFSRITGNIDSGCVTGEVATPHGFATVYSQGDTEFSAHTRIDFVHKGTLYMRNIEKRYSPQYLVTLANRFAEEICK